MKNKKLYLLIIAVLIVGTLLFVIIKPKKMVCTSKSDQSKNGYVIENKYVIKAKGKNVTKVEIKEIITSKDKDKLKDFKTQFEDQYSYFKKTYGGYEYKITTKGDTLTTNITIDYKKLDMDKFIENNAAMKQYTKKNKLTLEGAKKMYEASGATCK